MSAEVIELPLPEPGGCPGSGQAPAGPRKGAVYGGGCATCGAQVSVTPGWVIRSHQPREETSKP